MILSLKIKTNTRKDWPLTKGIITKTDTLPGKPFPYGSSVTSEGVNFAVYIKSPEKVSLCLFDEDKIDTPRAEYELNPAINRTGNIWHIFIKNLKLPLIYGIRVNGTLLLDPYAKILASSPNWNDRTDKRPYQPLGKVAASEPFDWQGVANPNIPSRDLIIYEMHVRGFTQDSTSGVNSPGTFLGIIEKIPYLKDLGVNAVELMPIFEFNEKEIITTNPKTKESLVNYFGYSHVSFFAPMNRYASIQRTVRPSPNSKRWCGSCIATALRYFSMSFTTIPRKEMIRDRSSLSKA